MAERASFLRQHEIPEAPQQFPPPNKMQVNNCMILKIDTQR